MASAQPFFNTIQTAIFSRRREIEVMKLVGASNWFIRVPFMVEGLLQGAIGALIWAVFSLNEGSGTQLLRLTYAIVFQLLALTLFVISGKK